MFYTSLGRFLVEVPRWIIRNAAGSRTVTILRHRMALGDLLEISALVRGLKKADPATRVGVATRRPEIFEHNPYVDENRGWHLWRTRYTVRAGYGGEEDSVIEMAPEHGWPQIVFDDQRIIEYDEALRAGQSAGDPQRGKRSWREEFAIAQADHPESYDQLYRCLRVTSNGRLLFQNLKEFAACPMPGAFLHRGAGIDVGVDRDETVLTISEHRGPVTNYLPSRRWRRTPVMALARELVETLVPLGIKPHDCGIEINGPGSFLADAMLTFPAMHGLNRITMQDQPYAPFKTSLVKGLIDDDLRGFIGMASRQDRAEASRVSYTVSNGLYKVEHCDLVSSMIVGRAARLRVIAA